MLKISVIIPVYNVEKYLNRCIESVLEQSYKDFELILVDDGSPDNCPEICDKYAGADGRITVIHKENGGLSSARNAGIEKAHGEYLYFLDSDDYVEKYTLEKAINATNGGEIDIVIFGIYVHTFNNNKENLGIIKRSRASFYRKQIYNNLGFMISNSMWNYVWDKLYKRETIISSNVKFNSNYDRVCEDTVFLYDVFPFIHSIKIIDDICYHYFIREEQSVVKKFIHNRFEKYIGRLFKLNELILKFSNTTENNNLYIKQYLYCLSWAYENLFHNDCIYTYRQRLEYLHWMRGIDSIVRPRRKEILREFYKIKNKLNVSGTSQIAIWTYLHGRIHATWVIHIITLLRNRRFEV